MKTVRAICWGVPIGILFGATFAGVWVWPDLLPRTWTMRAWGDFARQSLSISGAWLSSLLFSSASTLLAFLIAFPAARRRSRRPYEVWDALFLLPAVLPPLCSVWGLQALFAVFGLSSTLGAIVLSLTIQAFPYVYRALEQGYRLVGSKTLLAASNLGANPKQVLFWVEIPALTPAIALAVTLSFFVTWSEYLIFAIVGGGAYSTLTLTIYPFLLSSDRASGALGILVFLTAPIVLWTVTSAIVQSSGSRIATQYGEEHRDV